MQYKGLPWWLNGKEATCQSRKRAFDPWVGKISWKRKWQLTPVFLPEKFHGERSLVGYSPCGLMKSMLSNLTKIKTKKSPYPFYIWAYENANSIERWLGHLRLLFIEILSWCYLLLSSVKILHNLCFKGECSTTKLSRKIMQLCHSITIWLLINYFKKQDLLLDVIDLGKDYKGLLKLLDEKLMGYFIMDDLAISGARNLLNNFKITERETNILMPSWWIMHITIYKMVLPNKKEN